MNQYDNTTLNLPAGKVLAVTASADATGSVVRLARMPGGGNAQSITAIAGANLDFGPYAEVERFKIVCETGTITASIIETAYDVAGTAAGKITAAITDNDTTHAPDGNSVYDALALKLNKAQADPTILQLPEKTPVNAVAASGTLTVTAGGAKIANGDTVTIDTKTYTFKTTLTPTEGEVLIGANDTAALLNLKNAINHEGTPDTDYQCAAAHPTVEGTSSNATTLVVTALTAGVEGNAIATTETGADLSWGAAILAGGIDGTPGVANETCADATFLYHCIAANTIAGANWRRIALGSAF